MSNLTALDQNNGYALAGLVIQIAFLIAALWFARNLLRTMRSFQEQIGALLKLSITGVASDRNFSTSAAARPLTDASPYWLAPSEPESAATPQPAERGPGHITVARRKMVLWLQAPMTSTQPAPWRRIISWLQAPAS